MAVGRTKAAVKIDARKRARERAAAFRERNEKLESLAADYFTASEREDEVLAELNEEIRKLQARADERTASAREDAAAAIVSMSAQASQAEIAERLGVATAVVRQALRAPGNADTTPVVGSTDLGGEPGAGGLEVSDESDDRLIEHDGETMKQ
ncbi:hypothetical protein [Rathayibacter sp. Leaf248]|uniref:hypothetical protein n=1 Tax=Rathayibacter sp. Leaf248 TaxID=2876555 RepID=UPI001E3E4B95|nr:hypothetical protein [Rathayibacter sp. Leaf248]